MNRFSLIVSIIFLFIFSNIEASDTLLLPARKNIIRLNLTPMSVVGPRSFVLGYERVVKPWQTFSVNVGYLEKAPLEDADGVPIKIFDQESKGGMDISIDYRFYSKKRNKNNAPDGLYWGPYASFYNIWQDGSLNLLNDKGGIVNTIEFNGSLSIYNAGVQLGYQFVFKKHITIDLILMGPSFSLYDLDLGLKFKTEIDPNDPFYEDLMNFLEHSNGFLATLIKNREISSTGRLTFPMYGFRYAFQVGYNF